jgi:3D (Asp-Asp-Asp) domain-containing protein
VDKDSVWRIVNSLVSKELPLNIPVSEPWARGSVQQDLRMMAIAKMAMTEYPGDFCEIGCMAGGTTSGMARIAKEFGRRVIAVDPWIPNGSDCSVDSFYKFCANTFPWKDIIDVIKLPSEDKEAIRYVKSRPLAFAYVDGRHDKEHVARDLETVSYAKVICVDDLWNNELLNAFNQYPRNKIWNPLTKEGYLI